MDSVVSNLCALASSRLCVLVRQFNAKVQRRRDTKVGWDARDFPHTRGGSHIDHRKRQNQKNYKFRNSFEDLAKGAIENEPKTGSPTADTTSPSPSRLGVQPPSTISP